MNRTKIQMHAHRLEARTTREWEERTAALNANQQPNGEIKREATATNREGNFRNETRTTEGLTGTDPMYEARTRRANWMAHNHKED